MTRERHLQQLLRKYVADGQIAGAVAAVWDDLLTHRSGFTYGDSHRGPISRGYREAPGRDIDSDVAPMNGFEGWRNCR